MSSPSHAPDFERQEIAHEDAIASRYNRDYHEPPILKRHHEDFAAYVAAFYRPGDRVLDLGCGPASMWSHWRDRLPGAGALVGVDLSPGMIDEARRLFPEGDFRVGSMLRLPLDAASVDLVIASSALHHVPDEALPAALQEIARVMTEHGTIVGREPAGTGRLGDQPGWLSAAIMNFRHLACRLTHTREYGEPAPADHHHAYDPKAFAQVLSSVFTPTRFEFRHPFSFYVGRVAHPLVVSMALWFDRWLGHRYGQEFYYAAAKNFATAGDVAACIGHELQDAPEVDRVRFMALLQEAAALLERELGDEVQAARETRGRRGPTDRAR